MAVRELTKNGRTMFEALFFVDGIRRRLYFPTRAAATRKINQLRRSKSNTTHALDSMDERQRSRLLQAWERAQAGGYSLIDACTFMEDYRAAETEILFGEACDLFVEAKRAKGLKLRSIETYKHVADKAKLKFADKPFHLISTREVEVWIDGLGYQPKGYNNFLQILNTIRNWTNARGHHVGKVNAFHYERRLLDVGEVEILTVDEVAELLVVAMDIPACAAVVVLVLLCGLRTSEALAIDWDSVHLDEEPAVVVVRAAAAKKRQRRTVELQPNAAAWLALAKAKGGELGMLDDVYYRAKRAAMPPIPKNGLRHSFCSYHLAKFKNIALTPHFAGNSPTMIDRHYKELVRPKAATAFWELWPDHKPRA